MLESHIQRRREIHALYKNELSKIDGVELMDNPSDDFNSNFWLSTILISPEIGKTPNDIRLCLEAENIESRLLWRPMHMQPIYEQCPFYGSNVSKDLFEKGLCLPSGSSLTDNDIYRVIDTLIKSLK